MRLKSSRTEVATCSGSLQQQAAHAGGRRLSTRSTHRRGRRPTTGLLERCGCHFGCPLVAGDPFGSLDEPLTSHNGNEAPVAQRIERRFPKPCVGCSNQPGGATQGRHTGAPHSYAPDRSSLRSSRTVSRQRTRVGGAVRYGVPPALLARIRTRSYPERAGSSGSLLSGSSRRRRWPAATAGYP